MKKIIYTHPTLGQLVATVSDHGFVSKELPVIWDEEIDGPIPDALLDKVEFLSKSGSSLVVDPVKKSANDVKKAAKDAKDQAIKSAQNLLSSFDLTAKPSAAELENLLKALIVAFRGN